MEELEKKVETPVEEKKDEPKETAEVAALRKEIENLKRIASNANSEAANYKRELRAKQSEAERAEADRAEREKQRDAEIAELRAYKREADYSEKLIAAGVDPVSAKAMAKAMPDGVDDSYFEATKQFIAVQKQTILNEKLAKQPGLSVGTPPSAADAQKDEDAKIRQWFGL